MTRRAMSSEHILLLSYRVRQNIFLIFSIYWNPTRGSGVSICASRTGHDLHPSRRRGAPFARRAFLVVFLLLLENSDSVRGLIARAVRRPLACSAETLR